MPYRQEINLTFLSVINDFIIKAYKSIENYFSFYLNPFKMGGIFIIFLVIFNIVHSSPLSEPIDDTVFDLARYGDLVYGDPNDSVGKMVDEWKSDDNVNPEELGSYFEGDILFPAEEGRNGLAKESTRWPNGVIPYNFHSSVPSSDRNIINRCISEYHAKTCLKFVPRTSQRDYIEFENKPTGCWSSVGRTGGKQVINLQNGGCTTRIGTPCHEIMHALGFLHEQNREDRDNFVRVLNQNIKPGEIENF